MSFQDTYKITNADRVDKGVYGLPDTPGMTTAAIQERFDSLGNLAIDKFNALVDAASDEIDGSDDKFPTNKAVQDYISGQGGQGGAIIDDTTPSLHKAYSSQKVENMFGSVAERVIDDSEPSESKTYSSAEIEERLSESVIDDTTTSLTTTYSSQKIENDFVGGDDVKEQTAVSTFSTLTGGLLSEAKLTLEPVQSGSGTPSPDNIRPISGHTEARLDVSDDDSTTVSYVTPLGTTIYMANIDMVSGECDVIGVGETYDGSNDEGWSIQNVVDGNTLFISTVNVPLANYSDKYISSISNPNTASSGTSTVGTYIYNSTLRVRVSAAIATTVSDFTTWLSNNPLQIVYELATPQHIQLSPQLIQTLVGENNLSAPLEGQTVDEVKYKPLAAFNDVINDSKASSGTTYSSDKINSLIPQIDDSATSATKVFSSLKTAALITELSERFDFSTTEKPIGWWTDGKVYYGKIINAMGCPKEMFGLMVDLGVEVDTFIGIFAVGNAQDDNFNGGYCMGGTIYCKVTKSEGQNTQIQPACAVMALSRVSLLVLYTKVED